jgi:hypothetical protein
MVSVQKLKVGLVAFLFLSLIGTPLGWAGVGDPDSPWKRLTLKGGWFFPLQDTNVRINGTGPLGLGTEIDLEDDLNLEDDVSSYRIDAKWRFFDRHALNFSFYDLSRDASTNLARDITIGDTTFPAGTPLFTSSWEHKVYAASYTWSFLQTNKYEVGLNIGAHITRLKLQVTGQVAGVLSSEIEAVTAPLPVLGFTGAYAFTQKLVLRSNLGGFYLAIDDFEGYLVNFDLDLEYNAWKYMGFGIGYNIFTMELDIEADNFNGSADYTYQGFKVFVKFYL